MSTGHPGEGDSPGVRSAGLDELPPLALVPPSADCRPLHGSVDVDGQAIVVWASGRRPERWLITRQREATVFETIETAARSWRPETLLVQPLPDGVVLASSLCAWRPDGADLNGVVVDRSGATLHEATLGHGINHLQTDSTGQVWVGYSDEGVYGNFGWNGPGPESPGVWGLARFGPTLEKVWDYRPPSFGDEESRGGIIDDCYALNVSDEQVYAYGYSDLSIIRIAGDDVEVFPAGIAGSDDILVSGASIALIGGYESRRNHVSIGAVHDGVYVERRSGELGIRREPFRATAPVTVSRGGRLHWLDGARWRRFDLAPAA